MRHVYGCTLLLCVICFSAFAFPITLFMDTDTFLARAKDIVVAECVSIPKQEVVTDGGMHTVEVDVLKVLRGDGKPGPCRIATIYDMKEDAPRPREFTAAALLLHRSGRHVFPQGVHSAQALAGALAEALNGDIWFAGDRGQDMLAICEALFRYQFANNHSGQQEGSAAVFLKAQGFPDYLRDVNEPAPWFANAQRLFLFEELLFSYVSQNQALYADALEASWGAVQCVEFRVRNSDELKQAEAVIGEAVDSRGQVAKGGIEAANKVLAELGSETRFVLRETSRRRIVSQYGVQEDSIRYQESVLLATGQDGWRQYLFVCSTSPKAHFTDVGYSPRKNAFLRDIAFTMISREYYTRIEKQLTIRPDFRAPSVEELVGLLYIEPPKAIGNLKLETVIRHEP